MLKYKFILIIFFVIGIIFYGVAQPGNSTMSPPDGCDLPECREACADGCWEPECLDCLESTRIPIDGGILWLLLAGAGYGVKKIVDHRKKQ